MNSQTSQAVLPFLYRGFHMQGDLEKKVRHWIDMRSDQPAKIGSEGDEEREAEKVVSQTQYGFGGRLEGKQQEPRLEFPRTKAKKAQYKTEEGMKEDRKGQSAEIKIKGQGP